MTDLEHNYFEAIVVGNIEYLRQCIEFGIDLNIVDMDSWTGLMNAYSVEVMEELLNAGADINFVNNYGLTALRVAIIKNNIAVVKYLISCGADIIDRNGNNAITLAQFDNFTEIENYLKFVMRIKI